MDDTIQDGEMLFNTIHAIATPCHMLGHLSLYLPVTQTLIADNAMVVEAGKLHYVNPQDTLDLAEAQQLIVKFCHYSIKQTICYHSGIYHDSLANLLP